MKKIFVFLLLMVVSFALKAQYPIQQNLGGDSTIIYIKGAARTVGGFINGTYTDTTAANLTRIRQYQAAQIFTTNDSAIWFRMPGATKWVRIMPATPPSPNVDTSYWSLSGNYVADRVATPKLGTTTNHELNIITNDSIRLTIPVYGIKRVTGNENRYLVIDTTIGSNMYVGYMDGGGGGGGGTTYYNSNIGSGYRWAVPGTNNVKTAYGGYGIVWDSTSNANALTAKLDSATVFPNIRSTIPGGWGLTGNAGTDTNMFVGTSDAKDLYFRTNRRISGIIENSEPTGPYYYIGGRNADVSIGNRAGELSFTQSTDLANTFFGTYAGRFTQSSANVFIGYNAGVLHRYGGAFGGRNVSIGQYSLATGYRAYDNTSLGTFTLSQLWDGVGITALGRDAFKSMTHSTSSTAVGAYSGLFNSTGIIGATITNPGSGYTTATVTISAPNFGPNGGNCSIQATGTAIINSGQIIGITITQPGCGYVNFVSDSINELGVNITWYGPTITITGDGTGATATPIFATPQQNTYSGAFAGLYRRYSYGETALGYLSAQDSRYKDSLNTFIGVLSDIDNSVSVSTDVVKSTAIGYNAKVGVSKAIILGATGSDQPNVGIGTTAPLKLLDVRGDVYINNLLLGRGKANNIQSVVIGNESGDSLTTGTSHVFIGYRAGAAIKSESYNVAIGWKSVEIGPQASNVVAIGQQSANKNARGGLVAIGAAAAGNGGTSNSVFIGLLSGYTATTSEAVLNNGNVGIGGSSLYKINANGGLNGSNVTAVGYLSGYGHTTGTGSTYIGANSGGQGTGTGSYITAIGSNTMLNLSSGSYITAIGYGSGSSLSTGNYNVIIGGNNGSTIATANRRLIISDGEGNIKLYSDSVGNVGIGTTAPDSWLHVLDNSGSIATGKFDAHENRTGSIVEINQAGGNKFTFNTDGSISMVESSLPSTPASGFTKISANTSNSKIYNTDDTGKSAQLIQDLQMIFGAGSGADSDTTAFTTSAIYGSFYNDADTIVVTSFKAVLQGTSPDVTYKIWYNDSLNVEAGATALNTSGNQVTNTTTGTNVTSITNTKIPPGVWVWVKTSTVATKPKYFSLTINGYRK